MIKYLKQKWLKFKELRQAKRCSINKHILIEVKEFTGFQNIYYEKCKCCAYSKKLFVRMASENDMFDHVMGRK